MRSGSVDAEDMLRAEVYGLLGQLLAWPPDAGFLARLRLLQGGPSALGQALAALAKNAASVSPQDAEEEFNALFIGINRGELVPYGSYYLTGFLNGEPLAALRADMTRLGIARADGVCEPEDAMASVCEMMRGLVDGTFAGGADLVAQREFFEAHLRPWGERFFADLEAASSAKLYRPVGTIGRLFLAIEAEAFSMLN